MLYSFAIVSFGGKIKLLACQSVYLRCGIKTLPSSGHQTWPLNYASFASLPDLWRRLFGLIDFNIYLLFVLAGLVKLRNATSLYFFVFLFFAEYEYLHKLKTSQLDIYKIKVVDRSLLNKYKYASRYLVF